MTTLSVHGKDPAAESSLTDKMAEAPTAAESLSSHGVDMGRQAEVESRGGGAGSLEAVRAHQLIYLVSWSLANIPWCMTNGDVEHSHSRTCLNNMVRRLLISWWHRRWLVPR